MAYPENKPSGNFTLRDYDFATNDTKKLPMDEYLFKNGYKNENESKTESVPDAHNQNWLFDLLHRNLKYTLETAEENKNLLATKVATPTTIGQVKIGYGLEITSNGVLSVVKGIAEDANVVSYDLPVGGMMFWIGENTPQYFIEPKGQILLRTQYPDLWQFAQDNNLVGKLFEAGDGETTFVVKDLSDAFVKIIKDNEKLGTFTQAGLPNITGSVGLVDIQSASTDGCFKVDNRTINHSRGTENYEKYKVNFNASNSNSIYGKSDTVTPANWGFKIILKALPTPPTNAVPTGTLMSYTGLSAPDGYIVANGAELSRTTFKNLYNWALSNELIIDQAEIPNTAHGYYGSGDGSTTFTIPDYRGVFMRCADQASNRGGAEPRTYQADGLPNITGNFSVGSIQGRDCAVKWATGVFASQNASSGNALHRAESATAPTGITFDASRSSSIYGNSNYVQPKSVSNIVILKY